MAQTEHLPIYKASYDLCLYLEQVVAKFARAAPIRPLGSRERRISEPHRPADNARASRPSPSTSIFR
jgi:hypothetical protein